MQLLSEGARKRAHALVRLWTSASWRNRPRRAAGRAPAPSIFPGMNWSSPGWKNAPRPGATIQRVRNAETVFFLLLDFESTGADRARRSKVAGGAVKRAELYLLSLSSYAMAGIF